MIGGKNKPQREERNHYFSYRAYDQGARALFTELAQVGA